MRFLVKEYYDGVCGLCQKHENGTCDDCKSYNDIPLYDKINRRGKYDLS